jgi:hypothetical protein
MQLTLCRVYLDRTMLAARAGSSQLAGASIMPSRWRDGVTLLGTLVCGAPKRYGTFLASDHHEE